MWTVKAHNDEYYLISQDNLIISGSLAGSWEALTKRIYINGISEAKNTYIRGELCEKTHSDLFVDVHVTSIMKVHSVGKSTYLDTVAISINSDTECIAQYPTNGIDLISTNFNIGRLEGTFKAKIPHDFTVRNSWSKRPGCKRSQEQFYDSIEEVNFYAEVDLSDCARFMEKYLRDKLGDSLVEALICAAYGEPYSVIE